MTISDRFRELVKDVQDLYAGLQNASIEENRIDSVNRALAGLAELQETVGEIPRIRLETELTPVLLKAHSQLDRSRLLLEEEGFEDRAASVWDVEQTIYRLLNDL